MNRRKNLKQLRARRPKKPTKRQLQHNRQMETLEGRLLLYCRLMGITPAVTPLYIRCTMPSGAELTVYKNPMRNEDNPSKTSYANIYYPYRRFCNSLYLDEGRAQHLFSKLGEQIDSLENGKPSPAEGATEPQAPAAAPEEQHQEVQADERKAGNIVTRLVLWWKNIYNRKNNE